MKEAGTKAFLFFFLIVLVMVFIVIGVAILAGGDAQKVVGVFSDVKVYAAQFLQWSFPRLANATSQSGEL
jgi:outer membrane lipoprotein-sorting protein